MNRKSEKGQFEKKQNNSKNDNYEKEQSETGHVWTGEI